MKMAKGAKVQAALRIALVALIAISAKAAPPDPTVAFPAKMHSFPLYGEAVIPNSKPGPDEETGADKGWIQKVSHPAIQVYLPAKLKATGASLLIIPGGGYTGLTFDFEGVQQAQYFIDHGIAAFVLKYRLPSDQTMQDKSIGPLQDAFHSPARQGMESRSGACRRGRLFGGRAPRRDLGDSLRKIIRRQPGAGQLAS
jgi:hypothetical protein